MNELERLERQTRLWHIEKAANKILEFVRERTREHYEADAMLRDAVERNLITIGEALARASAADPGLIQLITDVPRIIACRNHLVHNYPRVDPERIWDIVTKHLPTLLAEVRALLAEPDPAGQNPA